MLIHSVFSIILDNVIETHFDAIDRKDHTMILDEIELQLTHQPTVQTRNRKPMRIPNTLGATWELRCGANNRYRVFYDVDQEARIVVILAVGRKTGNAVWIGREEFRL